MIRALFMDLRFAFRQLRASRGFTLTAVLALALGVGVAAAVCSVTMNVLLRPLPYPDPGSLVGVAYSYPYERPNAEQAGTAADFVRAHSQAFSSSAVMDDSGALVNVSPGGGHAIQATALKVSEGYFRTLGIEPAVGRAFLQQEDLPGGPRAVILSNGFWTRVFNANPSIVGRAVRINQEQFTVVGVMPAHFAVTAETAPGVMADPDLWQPLQLSPKDPGYDGDNYEMIARLRPGVTLEQARQQLKALTPAFYRENPKFRKWYGHGNVVHEFRAFPLQDVVVGRVRRSLLTVFGAALAVLFVTCLNIAGLMIARAMGRSRELAVRAALGATGAQLVRLIACEGSLLAVGGGVLGIAVALVSARLMLQTVAPRHSRFARRHQSVDARLGCLRHRLARDGNIFDPPRVDHPARARTPHATRRLRTRRDHLSGTAFACADRHAGGHRHGPRLLCRRPHGLIRPAAGASLRR